MNRTRTHAFLHCALTPEGVYFDKDDILKWHLDENGWSKPGYEGIWLLDGTYQQLVENDGDSEVDAFEITNGALGWNGVASHYCYIGGTDKNGNCKDTRTFEQEAMMAEHCRKLVLEQPQIRIGGHNQVHRTKFCPSFYVPKWLESIGIPKENIEYRQFVPNIHVEKWRKNLQY